MQAVLEAGSVYKFSVFIYNFFGLVHDLQFFVNDFR